MAFLEILKRCKDTTLSSTRKLTNYVIDWAKKYGSTINISLLWSIDIAIRVISMVALVAASLLILHSLHFFEIIKELTQGTPVITHTSTTNTSKPSLDTTNTNTLDTTIKWLEGLEK